MLQPAARRLALFSASLGVAALAATPVTGAVVTNPLNLDLTNSANANAPDSKTTLVDFDADGIDDFSFTHSTNPVEFSGPYGPKTDYNGKLTLDAADTSLFLSVVKDRDSNAIPREYAENLGVGDYVGYDSGFIFMNPGGAYIYDNRLFDSSGDGNIGAFGDDENFNANGNAYVGFMVGTFGGATAPIYGYLEFTNLVRTFPFDDALNGATLVGVAYETTPGVPITIAPIVVPEPASIADARRRCNTHVSAATSSRLIASLAESLALPGGRFDPS